MNLDTSGEGQDTEDWLSEQTTDNWFDPSDFVGQQALRDIESPQGLRELVARTSAVVSVAVFLE